jgi:hypothetical protein
MGDWMSGVAVQAERLAADASPRAREIGLQLLRCIQCNLRGTSGRCDQCPTAAFMARAAS